MHADPAQRKAGLESAWGAVSGVLVACCGSHLLAFGAIAGLAGATLFGAFAAVLIVLGLVFLLVYVSRRRRGARCVSDSPTSRYPERGPI